MNLGFEFYAIQISMNLIKIGIRTTCHIDVDFKMYSELNTFGLEPISMFNLSIEICHDCKWKGNEDGVGAKNKQKVFHSALGLNSFHVFFYFIRPGWYLWWESPCWCQSQLFIGHGCGKCLQLIKISRLQHWYFAFCSIVFKLNDENILIDVHWCICANVQCSGLIGFIEASDHCLQAETHCKLERFFIDNFWSVCATTC